MAPVIAAAHQKAPFVQRFGQTLIALDVLGHAVHQLDNGPGRRLGEPGDVVLHIGLQEDSGVLRVKNERGEKRSVEGSGGKLQQ